MENKDKLLTALKNHIKKNAEHFPYIAQHWSINIEENSNIDENYLEFGKYNSKMNNSYPFYKPISKIINLNKLK